MTSLRGLRLGIAALGLTFLAITAFSACDRVSRSSSAPTPATEATVAPPADTPEPPPAPVDTPHDAGPPPTACAESAFAVSRGNSTRQMVALTFDAGSDAGYTTQILQTLRANGIKASFSLTGQWVEQFPDLAKAIAADGHVVMNHSQDHPSFTGYSTGTAPLSRQERIDELDQADVAIRAAAGVTTKPYFRPPYGDYDASVLCDAYAAGYNYAVLWTVDTLGWNGAGADQIVQTALSRAKPGAIYIMHVGSQSQDAAALQLVIDGLRSQGYSFGTISDILS